MKNVYQFANVNIFTYQMLVYFLFDGDYLNWSNKRLNISTTIRKYLKSITITALGCIQLQMQ